jgi:hypothetical protein
MSKEELVGRSFRAAPNGTGQINYIHDHKDPKYISVTSVPELTGARDVGVHAVDSFNENLRAGTWKLIEEDKPKMYKTSKGIEYGVGTQFKHKDSDPIYTITELAEYPVFFSHRAGGDKEEYNKTSKTWSKDKFAELLDEGTWVIINNNMEDYKQVDPKTIKFDFSNMTIKTNNPDEHKWIQEVAFNKLNNKRWIGDANQTVSYTDESGIQFMLDGKLARGYRSSGYKEITIQDILNNMKEVIEVGDTVDSIMFSGRPGVVTRIEASARGRKVYYLPDNNFNYEHDITLVSKGNKMNVFEKGDSVTYKDPNDGTRVKGVDHVTGSGDDAHVYYVGGGFDYAKELKIVTKAKSTTKEVVGYESVVDLPGIPKGSKTSTYYSNGNGSFKNPNGKTTDITYGPEQFADTKFFKPIYKSDEIVLKMGKHTATLSKDKGLVFSDGESLPFADAVRLVGTLKSNNVKVGTFGNYGVTVDVEYKNIKVGCKSFTPTHVSMVEEAIKTLNA